MLSEKEKKYYHKINNLDISLEETNHKYIMINQWDNTYSYKHGIAVFKYDDEGYWYLKSFNDIDNNGIDWYDLGCLVKLGFKWIKEMGW